MSVADALSRTMIIDAAAIAAGGVLTAHSEVAQHGAHGISFRRGFEDSREQET